MKNRIFAFMATVLLLPVVLASEPGEPLSHEDWVVLLPGAAMQPVVPIGTECVANCLSRSS